MMKDRWILMLTILLSITILSCSTTTDPNNNDNNDDLGQYAPLVEELNELIHPLDGTSPQQDDGDLDPLSYLGACKIVGLGEATHGTKEFFQMKHRIFKYLVENYGFKAFGFEADMGESIYLDRYVCKGEGDLESLMIYTMQFWTWRTDEVKELLEWMRDYNQGKSEPEMIHYVGIDCQFLTHQPDLILEYFDEVKPEFIEQVEPTLNMIKALDNTSYQNLRNNYAAMNASESQAISDSVDMLLSELDAIEDECVSKSSEHEFQTIRQLLKNIQQVNHALYDATHEIYSDARDLHMAENAVWLSSLFGESTKIAIWAHNGHVLDGTDYQMGMGYHIRCQLGDQYRIVGFSFSKGSFNAITQTGSGTFTGLDTHTIAEEPRTGSINYILHHADCDNFILKTGDIPYDSELGIWLAGRRPFMQIGSIYNGDPYDYYSDYLLRAYFDVLIHIDVTTAASRLGKAAFTKDPMGPDRNDFFLKRSSIR